MSDFSTGVKLIGVYTGYRMYRPKDGGEPRCMMNLVAGSTAARLFYDKGMADALDEHSVGEICSVSAEPYLSSNNRICWSNALEPEWIS